MRGACDALSFVAFFGTFLSAPPAAAYFAAAAAGNLSPGSAVLYCLRRHNLYCRCVMRREIVIYTAARYQITVLGSRKIKYSVFYLHMLNFGTEKLFGGLIEDYVTIRFFYCSKPTL